MNNRTYPYDTAEFLGTDEAIASFAEAVLDENDRATFRPALDSVARAYGFAVLAEKAGIPRRRLFEALLYPGDEGEDALKILLQAATISSTRVAAE